MDTNPQLQWQYFQDTNTLIHHACRHVLETANTAINQAQRFRIVLSGGTTPKALYTALRSGTTDWSKWEIYFTDERCLPTGDSERNDFMAQQALLNHVPVAAVHTLPAELGPENGAIQANQQLDNTTPFDLVLLGIGEDGHTASLFPGINWGKEQNSPAVIPVHNSPKPPPQRLSLSLNRLANSHQALLLSTGDAKLPALRGLAKSEDNSPLVKLAQHVPVQVYYQATQSV